MYIILYLDIYLAKRIIIHTWPISNLNVADDLAKVLRTGKMNMLQLVTRGGLTEVRKTICILFYVCAFYAFIFILMSMV